MTDHTTQHLNSALKYLRLQDSNRSLRHVKRAIELERQRQAQSFGNLLGKRVRDDDIQQHNAQGSLPREGSVSSARKEPRLQISPTLKSIAASYNFDAYAQPKYSFIVTNHSAKTSYKKTEHDTFVVVPGLYENLFGTERPSVILEAADETVHIRNNKDLYPYKPPDDILEAIMNDEYDVKQVQEKPANKEKTEKWMNAFLVLAQGGPIESVLGKEFDEKFFEQSRLLLYGDTDSIGLMMDQDYHEWNSRHLKHPTQKFYELTLCMFPDDTFSTRNNFANCLVVARINLWTNDGVNVCAMRHVHVTFEYNLFRKYARHLGRNLDVFVMTDKRFVPNVLLFVKTLKKKVIAVDPLPGMSKILQETFSFKKDFKGYMMAMKLLNGNCAIGTDNLTEDTEFDTVDTLVKVVN